MAVYNKFNIFTKDLIDGKHNFSSNVFKVMLTNTAPNSSNTQRTDLIAGEPATLNGYTSGGNTVTITATTSSGVAKVTASNTTFTATGAVGPFQYAVLYNSTTSGNPLVAWWDYGSPITLANTETLTVVFDATNGIFTVS